MEVARSWGTYVLVHAHTSPAMRNAVAAGARSIEHGSILDEETAVQVARAGAYIVPTLIVLNPPEQMQGRMPRLTAAEERKLAIVSAASRRSLQLARQHGIPLGSGSDLIGPDQGGRAWEIVQKAQEMGAMGAIESATRVNAELFGLSDRIGTIEAGKDADLILVRGDVLARIETLAEPDGVPLVMRRGEIVRDDDGRAGTQ